MSKEYKLIYGEKAVVVPENVLKNVLALARESIQNGVYAAKKADTYIMLNEPNLSRERFRKLTKDYNKQGFVLLHNRGVAHG